MLLLCVSVCWRLHSLACACLSYFAIDTYSVSPWSISFFSPQKTKSSPAPQPPLIQTPASTAGPSCHHSTPLPPLLLLTQSRGKKTSLINNPPKGNSPTAHWANSSYQPQIRLCLWGSLPICTKTPQSDSTIQLTHIHTHFFDGGDGGCWGGGKF